jgi:hypothetical protein
MSRLLRVEHPQLEAERLLLERRRRVRDAKMISWWSPNSWLLFCVMQESRRLWASLCGVLLAAVIIGFYLIIIL